MYLSKSHLQKVESLNVDDASKIWGNSYFSGWGKLITWVVLSLIIGSVYLLNIPNWSVFPAVLFVHAFIAIPLASKAMYKSVQQLKSGTM